MTHTFFKVCSKTKCSDHHHHLPSFHPSPGVPFLTSAQQASHDFPAFPTPSILHYHQLQGHQTFPPPPPPPSLSVSAKSRSYTCTYSCKRCYILTTMVGVRVCVWVILWVAAAKHGDGVTVSAPAPSLDCSSAFLELTDCLTFVENGSTVAKPAGKCCSGLKKVVKKEVSCLCDVFKQGASLGVNITKALTLPSACGVSTPPFSKCNSSLSLSLIVTEHLYFLHITSRSSTKLANIVLQLILLVFLQQLLVRSSHFCRSCYNSNFFFFFFSFSITT